MRGGRDALRKEVAGARGQARVEREGAEEERHALLSELSTAKERARTAEVGSAAAVGSAEGLQAQAALLQGMLVQQQPGGT